MTMIRPAASQRIIDRIKKLQALAEGSEGNEAEQAAALALRLQREHLVTQEELDEKDRDKDPLVRLKVTIIGLRLWQDHHHDAPKRTAEWKRQLAGATSRYMDCKWSLRAGTPWLSFWGHQSDCELAQYLFNVAAMQIEADRESWEPSSADFRRSAVNGLESKFNELKREVAVADTSGTAIVIRRKHTVDAWCVEQFKNFRPGKKASSYNHSTAGYQAGKRIKLHKPVEDNGSTRLIGES